MPFLWLMKKLFAPGIIVESCTPEGAAEGVIIPAVSECCPCRDWHIVTYCPCELCPPYPACYAGIANAYTNDPSDPFYDASVEGQDVTLDGEEILRTITVDLDGHAPGSIQEECISVGYNCYFHGIRATISEAPFTGTVRAELRVADSLLGVWEGSCVEGQPIYVGRATFDEGVEIPVLKTNTSGGAFYKFSTPGPLFTTIRLNVILTHSGDVTKEYHARIGVRIYGGVKAMHAVEVVPRWALIEHPDCPWVAGDGTPLKLVVFGYEYPYDSPGFDRQEDAQAVLDDFNEELTADWAPNCACRADCDIGTWYYAADSVGEYDNGMYLLDYTPAGTGGAVAGSDYCWLRHQIVLCPPDGVTMQIRKYDAEGNYTVVNTSECTPAMEGCTCATTTTAPCEHIQICISEELENAEAYVDILYGSVEIVGTLDTCDHGDNYWTYANCGIPTNADEYSDYLEV